MNTAIVLAAGVGQRMRNGGLPKQFLKIMGKPIVIYTLERFDECTDIDNVIVVCHGGYVDYMKELIEQFHIRKVIDVIVGGADRQSSILKGLHRIEQTTENMGQIDPVVVIHDGVRPLVGVNVISENIFFSEKYGCAITVHSVKESVVVTDDEFAEIGNFQERAKTYSLTSPQSFRFSLLKEAFSTKNIEEYKGMPLLDAAMVYAKSKGKIYLVKEQGVNIKITTPEDFYYLKAILELEEQKYIFGI